jgi:OOP family OmpA-OmpF porin
MTLRKLTLALALAGAGIALAQAADVAPITAPATPQTPEAWLERMTDFTRNASAYKDPNAFMPWLNAVTEPSFYIAAGQGMMDPQGWIKMMNSAMQPGVVTNYGQFADPTMYLKWLAASMNPNTYAQIMTILTDPNKMMRWVNMPMDPKLWQMMMTPLNPNQYTKWMLAPMDPKAMQMMTAPMNPNVYMGWMGNMMNPATYYPGFNTWMQAGVPQPMPSAMPAPIAAPAPAPVVTAPSPMVMPALAPMPPAAPAEIAPPAAPVEIAPPAVPVKTVLDADALFPSGKSSLKDISDAGKQKLDELAAGIKAVGGVDVIKITGHADKSGKAKANQTLSLNRAKAVKDYLVSKGVNTKAFQTVGAGDTQPVKECDMKLPSEELKACLAPNRRVEVHVVASNQ